MNIELDYIRQIHKKHEEWLVGNENTIIIDGEENMLVMAVFYSISLYIY